MFSSDWGYNFAPTGFKRQRDACCPEMALAFKKNAVDILSNYKHVVTCDYDCLVLDYCPWCRKDLRIEE
jgi:hypothetical protein